MTKLAVNGRYVDEDGACVECGGAEEGHVTEVTYPTDPDDPSRLYINVDVTHPAPVSKKVSQIGATFEGDMTLSRVGELARSVAKTALYLAPVAEVLWDDLRVYVGQGVVGWKVPAVHDAAHDWQQVAPDA